MPYSKEKEETRRRVLRNISRTMTFRELRNVTAKAESRQWNFPIGEEWRRAHAMSELAHRAHETKLIPRIKAAELLKRGTIEGDFGTFDRRASGDYFAKAADAAKRPAHPNAALQYLKRMAAAALFALGNRNRPKLGG
jgi:hypothetical protein